MTLSLDTAYRSFGGEVEASSTPTICRLPDSRRHQLRAIARMTGAIDTDQKTVTVAVYDQGISIPASLPQWKHWGRLEKMLRRISGTGELSTRDDVSIRLAMAISRSATNL